jgi:oligoendopeptidase F
LLGVKLTCNAQARRRVEVDRAVWAVRPAVAGLAFGRVADLLELSDPDREAAVWNLEPIVDNEGEDGARQLLKQARFRADAFTTEFAGSIARLEVDALVNAVSELTEIRELMWRADGYGRMRGYADSSDPIAGALQGAAEAAQAEIDAKLLFFELEWVALDDDRAEALLAGAGDRLDFAAHHLRRLRGRRPYLLSHEQERVLAETSVQRLSAWKRLYSENAACLTAEIDGGSVPMTQALSLLGSPAREVRLQAMAAIADGAAAGLPARVAAYNQVLGEKAVDDRLRGYPTWLSSRNLANETTDAAVENQLAAIAGRYDLPRRWNRLKARLLDVEQLTTSDLRAPLLSIERPVAFRETRQLITSAWSSFSPRAGAIIDVFFTQGLIDAPIRANKQGGALCAQAGASSHPYVLLNYDSRPEDTMSLAHELGHALHFELARAQRALQCETSIPMLEVASTFSEALIAEHLMARAADDRDRLALLAARLDDAMLNVFEGCALVSAEAEMHRHRREHGELGAEELSEIWTSSLSDLWQDTIDIEDGIRLLWSLIPHMIWEPGYLYSYSYGLLTAWSAFARYKQIGEELVEDYLAMLAAGGSRSPEELAAMIGLDVAGVGFWNAGLDLLDNMLKEAEALAETL